MVKTTDVRNSFKESGRSCLVFLGMGKHYQKRIGASRYFKEISEKAKKSLITAIMK
jgi:hypothetical protein